MKKFSLILFCFLSISALTWAHGDLDKRIAETSEEIEMHPDSSYLYFKRGKLLYQHEVYDSSLVDFKFAEEMGYTDIVLDLSFAQLYIKMDSSDSAIEYADKILAKDSLNVNALKYKGKALAQLKEFEASAKAFEQVIQYTIRSFPFNYIDAAEAWVNTGIIIGTDNSLKVLDEGIKELGPIMSLFHKKVQICLEANRFDQAIAIQTEIIELSNRKETAIYERGLMQREAGNLIMADQDFKEALRLLEALPLKAKNTRAMRNLFDALNALTED